MLSGDDALGSLAAVDDVGRDGVSREGRMQGVISDRDGFELVPVLGVAGADDLGAGADLGESRKAHVQILRTAVGIVRDDDDLAVLRVIRRNGRAAGVQHRHAGADVARILAEAVVLLGENDAVVVMVSDAAAPEAALRIDHALVLVAVHADRRNVVVDDLPDDPCGRIQAVHIDIDSLRKPESRAHLTCIRAGCRTAVHLTHPEVLTCCDGCVAQFLTLITAVGMCIDTGNGILCIAGELVERVDLRVDRGLVRADDQHVIQAALSHGFLQFHDHGGFGVADIEVTALLLGTVCPPEVRIGLVECLNALYLDAPDLLVMVADLSEILCKIVIAVVLQVVRTRILVTGGAAGFTHVVVRRIGEHLHDHVIPASLDGTQQHIALVGVLRPVIGRRAAVPVGIAGHIGVSTGDVVMVRVITAADVETGDVQAQAIGPVERIRRLLCKRIAIADAVCPPAE